MDAGVLKAMVEELWASGRRYNFRPPVAGAGAGGEIGVGGGSGKGKVEGGRLGIGTHSQGERSRSRTPVRIATPSEMTDSPGR